MIQLSSHNYPSDINEELRNTSSAVVVCAYFESFDDSVNFPILLGCIEPASGNTTDGPVYMVSYLIDKRHQLYE